MARPIVPDAGRVADKWSRRATGASGDYKTGVESTAADWAALTTAAKDVWKTAVTAAAGRGAYEKGIARVGSAKWKNNAASKGPDRYMQGVSLGQADYSSQVAPYLQLIGSTDLPPRGPAGSPGNIQRVAALATALRGLKERR
jgi:hypothetical protein